MNWEADIIIETWGRRFHERSISKGSHASWMLEDLKLMMMMMMTMMMMTTMTMMIDRLSFIGCLLCAKLG